MEVGVYLLKQLQEKPRSLNIVYNWLQASPGAGPLQNLPSGSPGRRGAELRFAYFCFLPGALGIEPRCHSPGIGGDLQYMIGCGVLISMALIAIR